LATFNSLSKCVTKVASASADRTHRSIHCAQAWRSSNQRAWLRTAPTKAVRREASFRGRCLSTTAFVCAALSCQAQSAAYSWQYRRLPAFVASATAVVRQIRHATWSGTMRRPRLTLERTKCCHAQRMSLLRCRLSFISLRASAVSERRARHALKDVATRFERRWEHCRRRCGAAAVLASFAAAQRHHKPHAVRSAHFWEQRIRSSQARVGCPGFSDRVSTAS